MNLKQVVVNNGGMSQDLSVSKQENKLAFENQNIRIQATDDGTLLSVTNLKSPKQVLTIPAMKILGSCATPEYIVLFGTQGEKNETDIICRINLQSLTYNILYNGSNLDFAASVDSYFDTLYYEEGENVKKVYWTDGVHQPRVINIISPKEREGQVLLTEEVGYISDVFEFYPKIYQTATSHGTFIPKILVEKNRNVTSQLPAGVVQYFVSYYWENGAETLIAASSDLYTIDYSDRGAKADETGMCAFDIKIPASTVNHDFDYMRVYSAIRTSYNGPLIVKIVGDIKLDKSNDLPEGYEYTLLDDGITQEQLQDSALFFIGGTPFIAKTLTDKDETLFFGGIQKGSTDLNKDLENAIGKIIRTDIPYAGGPQDSVKWWANDAFLHFIEKKIPASPNQFNSFYNYKLQLDKGAQDYRTFKSGEIYRFGIQFQTDKGEWSEVCWIGDKECTMRPKYDEETNSFVVNGLYFQLSGDIIRRVKDLGFVNYRIVIADAENTNARKIKAQGILSPTLFTPGQRALNSPYVIPSWSMRPRKGKAAYHHMEPLFSAEVDGAEIASYHPDFIKGSGEAATIAKEDRKYSSPFYPNIDVKQKYIVTFFGCSPGSEIWVRCVEVTSDYITNNFYKESAGYPEPSKDEYRVLCDYVYDGGGASNSKYGEGLTGHPTSTTDSHFQWLAASDSENLAYGSAVEDFKNIVDVYTSLGIDERLLPDPSLLKEWGKDLVGQYAISIVSDVFTALLASLTAGISATTEGVISGAKDADQTSALYASAGISAALGGVSTAAWKGAKVILTEINSPREVILTDDAFLSLLGTTDYNKLAEYQKSLWKMRFVPLYTTHVAKQPKREGVSNATLPKYKRLNNIVFSNNKAAYRVEQKYYTTIPNIFKPKTANTQLSGDTLYGGADPYFDQLSVYVQVLPVTNSGKFNTEVKDKYYDYFIDESWVTFNSPELEETRLNSENLNLRIVGTVPYENSYADFQTQLNASVGRGAGLNYEALNDYKNDTYFNPFLSDYLWYDYIWNALASNPRQIVGAVGWYKTFLFSPDNYLGVSNLEDISQNFRPSVLPGKVIKQQVLNHNFSYSTSYFNTINGSPIYNNIFYAQTFDGSNTVFVKDFTSNVTYSNNYDTLVVQQSLPHLFVGMSGSGQSYKFSPSSVRIKFSTTPHVLLNLADNNIFGKRNLLPRFDNISEEKYSENVLYTVFEDSTITTWDTSNQRYYNNNADITIKTWPENTKEIIEIKDNADKAHIIQGQGYKEGFNASTTVSFTSIIMVMSGYNNPTSANPYTPGTPDYDDYATGQALYEECPCPYSASGQVPWKDGFINGLTGNTSFITDEIRYWMEMPAVQSIANTDISSVPDGNLGAAQYFKVTLSLGDSSDYYFSAFDRKVNVYEGNYRGEWHQNNYEDYSNEFPQAGIWQSGKPYHCGSYFAAVDGATINNDDYTSFLTGKLQGSIPFYSSLASLAKTLNKIDDSGSWAIDEEVGADKYTILSGLEDKAPACIIGVYELLNPHGNPTVYSQCSQFKQRLSSIKLKLNSNRVPIEVTACSFVSNDGTHTYYTEDDIYLNELYDQGIRLYFKTYTNSSPRLFSSDVSAYEFEPVKDFDIKYTHPVIHGLAPSGAYSFIGELYLPIEHEDLYGGYNDANLRLLSWYPITNATKLTDAIDGAGGDTYYQRWDCLKTYPTTEEDVNQYVDITSFMVESHINLDARTDVNRGQFNIMSRPTNFNLFNPVYNQQNNIFEYTTDWNDLQTDNLSNYVTWSTTKNLFGDVDTWTNVSLTSSTRTKYPVTKLTTFNNQILALTEHALEIINFNKKQLVPTDDNSFIELQNSKKVDGTVTLQYPYGTHNMSTLITEQGLYFIEDNEKSIIRLGGQSGITKLGFTKLTDWLHNHIVQGSYTHKTQDTYETQEPFHLEYDAIHKDVYILNDNYGIIFNEALNEFTSFITYSGRYWLCNYGGKFYAYREGESNALFEMFGADSYNEDFNGDTLKYSVSYVINPNSYTDKVFTNGILAADLGVTNTNMEGLPNSTKDTSVTDASDFPFHTMRVWTEHQDTEDQQFEKLLDTPSNLKQKFRFWKFLIPRDLKTNTWPRNRIRNPWMRIKLIGNSKRKIEFHNMTIQYME